MAQAALADQMDLSAMAVGKLCDRMQVGGWERRAASAKDRRANQIHLEPRAEKALAAALVISDAIQAQILAGLNAAERSQLLALLKRAHVKVTALVGSSVEE